MLFEWDTRKDAKNIARRRLPFEYVTRVFLDPDRLDSIDARKDHGEVRRLVFGKIEQRLYVVAYTMRGDRIRIISARKANKRERRLYDKTLSA